MFSTIGIIKGNTVHANDSSLEKYNGKKVLITVLDDEKQYETISDEQLLSISDSLIQKNMEAYRELAK
ncbi:MAG: hypothetical protein K6G52_05660 [Treponemataceae bacterium]|nr:hypothetical protein [Treponemataceae bacterium]